MAEKTITVRLTAAVSQYQAAMGSAVASTKAFGNSALKAATTNKQAFTTMGLAAAAFGGLLAFGLKRAADAAFEFQGKMLKLQTLVGLSADEVDKLGESVIGLAGDVGVGPTELADALYFVTSSGFQASEAMAVVEASAKAAAIGLGTTGEVADAVTSVMNAYGHEAYSAAQVTDILAEAVNKGKLEANELAPVLGNIVPIASALGIGFEDVAGTLAVLSLRGTDAAEGATMVSGVLASLLQTTPKVTEALDNVGLTMKDLRTVAGEDGLYGVMTLLNNAFHGNIEALREIFPNIRAFRGVMSALSGDVAQTRSVLNAVADSTGTVDEAFRDWSDSAVAAKAKFSASFEAMAVVIGSVFLPVLANVFDAFRGFADFITNLPGPIKTLAVGLIAVAAAIGLVGGAALLALPRIAAVREALATIGGGKVAGAIRGFAGFLTGPWSLALAAATVGLAVWSAGQNEARQRVEDLTDAITADSGALGENTRAKLANTLADKGVIENAHTIGLTADTVVDAILGEKDALFLVNDAIDAVAEAHGTNRDVMIASLFGYDEQTTAAIKLAQALPVLTDEVNAAKQGAKDEAEAMDQGADSTVHLSDVTDDTTKALEGMQAALDSTKEAADSLTTALEFLAGAQIDEQKALIGWKQSLADMAKELHKGTKTLDSNTQAGRDNQQSILDAVDAAIEHGAAVARESGSVRKGAQVVMEHVRALEQEAIKAGLSKKEVHDYIRELNLTPAEIRTTLKLLGLNESQNAVDQFITSNSGRTIHINVKTGATGPGPIHEGGLIRHSGGPIGRYHAGGLKGDEVLAVLQRGEFVISRKAVERVGAGYLSMLNAMHDGGLVRMKSASAAPRANDNDLRVLVRLGRRRFTDEVEYQAAYSGEWS